MDRRLVDVLLLPRGMCSGMDGTFLAGLKCSRPTVLSRRSKRRYLLALLVLLVLQQGSKEGRCKIAPCRFEVSATRPGSTNMELSVACLTCNANPLHHALNHPRKLHHQKGGKPTLS